jgi:hypothetical protein
VALRKQHTPRDKEGLRRKKKRMGKRKLKKLKTSKS